MLTDTPTVLDNLEWMEDQGIWPNGLRYLWTDAFGLVLLVSLHRHFGDAIYLERAERLVKDVDRVLGREKGYRIGEEPDRDGQYFHYLAMWIYALGVLGEIEPFYWKKAVKIARDIHTPFVLPNVGVHWKMREDLSGPYPGFGLGALDAFHGYVVYRTLAPDDLHDEILQLESIVETTYPALRIDQDLGLGMMLWMTHFVPDAPWARLHRARSLHDLHERWIDPPGYFCRQLGFPDVRFAFTNYGVSLGLQAVGEAEDKVHRLNDYFRTYRSGDEYDRNAITHVMACTSHFPGAFIKDWTPRPRPARDA